MIPKIIHYCWFGKRKKPHKIIKCIESWKKLQGYKIIEWNEDNFNIHINEYTETAYRNKKYAFVSDIARLVALRDFGGIYLDTDVFIYKSFDEILDKTCVLGFEEKNFIATSFIACEKNHPLIALFLSLYNNEKYDDYTTNVVRATELLVSLGLITNGKHQYLQDGIVVYPQEYFSPYDYINCIMKKTDNSICAHLFYVSWMPFSARMKKIIKMITVKIIGVANMEKLRDHFQKRMSDKLK